MLMQNFGGQVKSIMVFLNVAYYLSFSVCQSYETTITEFKQFVLCYVGLKSKQAIVHLPVFIRLFE